MMVVTFIYNETQLLSMKDRLCLRCGHEWQTVTETRPCICPKCRTRYWDKPYGKQKNCSGPDAVLVHDGYKRCSAPFHQGDNPLPISNFHASCMTKSGYAPACKACVKIRRQKAAPMRRELDRELHRKYVREHRQRSWAWHTLLHHRQRGIDVELTVDELERMAKSTDNCVMCGKKFIWTNGSTLHDTPTLDRTNNEQTIRKDNVLLICHQCNRTKGERTMKEFVDYCRKIVDLHGGDPPCH